MSRPILTIKARRQPRHHRPVCRLPASTRRPPARRSQGGDARPDDAPADRYAPPGGYNLPQSSIDRSKVSNPATGEVKAGGTAIARRSLAADSRTIDRRYAVDRRQGNRPPWQRRRLRRAAATAPLQESPPADSLAEPKPDNAPAETSADSSADASTELADTQSSNGAAVAFADATNSEASADETGSDASDQGTPLASAPKWTSGAGAPEQTLAANNSTLRILGAEENPSGDVSGGDTDADARTSVRVSRRDSNLAMPNRCRRQRRAGNSQADSDYVVSTAVGGWPIP